MKMLDVTLKERVEKKEEIEVKPQQYNWMWENNINSGKVLIDIDTPQEFKYSQWRTNSSLSSFSETIFQANYMNMSHHISDKMHYHFLFYTVRKVKRYGKKKTEEDKRLEREFKREQELLALLQDYYKYNIVRAKEALKLLSPSQIDIIIKKQEKGGAK